MDDILLQRIATIVQIASILLPILGSIPLFIWRRRDKIWNVLLKYPKVTIIILLVIIVASNLLATVVYTRSAFLTSNTTTSPNTNPLSTTSTPQSNETSPTPTPTNTQTSSSINTPTPSITPTQTPSSTTDTDVLCESGPSDQWKDWELQQPWLLNQGKSKLLHKGSDSNGSGSNALPAPPTCQPTTINYAIEVKMKWISYPGKFGIFARKTKQGQYLVNMTAIQGIGYSYIEAIYLDGVEGKRPSANVNTDSLHTYSLEVIDNYITLKLDDKVIASFNDNRLVTEPGQVGIYADNQVEITSFRVIRL